MMQPRFLQETRTWDVIVDDDGNVFGAAAGAGVPQLKEKLKKLRAMTFGTQSHLRVVKHKSTVANKPKAGDKLTLTRGSR